MSKELTLHQVPFNHLYRDLSFEDFFKRYDPWRDGKVRVATMSFNHKNFDFWAKLRPESIFYIADYKNYKSIALEFLKRYPWFEIYSVPKLHSKVIFFERSGVLLLGSQNLYAGSSEFSEIMIETVVHQKDHEQVLDLLFGNRHLNKNLLYCKYGLQDIRIYKQGLYEEGTLCLPNNLEINHWNLIANKILFEDGLKKYPEREHHYPGKLYTIFEYTVANKKHYLGTDRGYHYCGDLDQKAFDWIIKNCQIEQVIENYIGGHFPSYHRIPQDHIPDKVFWLGLIKNHKQYEKMKIFTPQVDITDSKIRKSDSLTSYLNSSDF